MRSKNSFDRPSGFKPPFVATALLLSLAMLLAGCGRPTGSDSRGRMVIQNKGSDTLVNVAQAWAEEYKKVKPDVAVAVTGGGSGTGISAMINGTVDIANASRDMKSEEIKMAQDNGVDPIEHVVGYDALAVFLHSDNPITEMSLPQLAEIYGEGGKTEKWSQLGIEVPGCPSDEIIRISRQNNSGTYVYFQETVLGKTRDFKLGSRDMHGSKDVVDVVAHTPCAIGYSGLAYANDELKTVCLTPEDGTACVPPSIESAINGTYPVGRALLMYTAGEPTGAIKDYLDWILSDEGQCIILEKGYAPVRSVSCG